MPSLLLFFFVLKLCLAKKDYAGFFETERYTNYSRRVANLYDELFTNRHYNRLLSPVYEETLNLTDLPPTLEVDFVLDFLQIFGLDAQSQLLSTCIQLRMSWLDPRLSWNPNEFGGITQLHVLADAVWIPDNQFGSVLRNHFIFSKVLDDMLSGGGKSVKITNDGMVEMVKPYYMEVACQITKDKVDKMKEKKSRIQQITTFPFDNQTCQLPLLSFSYDSAIMTTNGSVSPILREQLATVSIGNGEWQCTGIDQKSFDYGEQQLFRFFLKLKRVPNYYIYVIALPCFVMTFLSILGMFWTRNSESKQLDRLIVGLTSLITMTVLLDLLSTSIPKTSVFPLLGIYVIFCVGIISVCCFFITIGSTKDLPKQTAAELHKRLEAEKSLPRNERLWEKWKGKLFHQHVFLGTALHILNLIGFIVFMSFWK